MVRSFYYFITVGFCEQFISRNFHFGIRAGDTAPILFQSDFFATTFGYPAGAALRCRPTDGVESWIPYLHDFGVGTASGIALGFFACPALAGA